MQSETGSVFKQVFLVWLAGCFILTIVAWPQISNLSGWGPDDQLRLVQLRDFLAGQAWFDNSQYRLNTPYGTDMHWSRIIELPLAFLIFVLSPIFGREMAEIIAAAAVPLFLFLGVGFFLADTARRIGGKMAAPVAVIICLFTPTLLAQLLPTRVDHHGWQIMLACVSLWSLFLYNKRIGGLVLGSALALWIHISLEGAPMTAIFFIYLGWRWMFHRAHGERLLWTLIIFAPASLFLFFVANFNGFSLAPACDAVTAPHLAAIGAATAVMVPAILFKIDGWQKRAMAAALAGLAAAGLLYFLAPNCLLDGFGELDPLVRRYWYNGVTEGLPIWRQGGWSAIGWIMAAIMGLIALQQKSRAVPKGQRESLQIIGWFQITSLIVALLIFRSAAVACAFAIPSLANWMTDLVGQYRASVKPLRKARLAIMIMLIVTAGSMIIRLGEANKAQASSSAKTENSKPASAELGRQCQSPDSISSLNSLENARIIAPFDIGPVILLKTRHSILASSHHRNNAGMRDQIEIFIGSPETSYEMLKARGITHLVVCPGEAEMRQYIAAAPTGLWAQIDNGSPPNWLSQMREYGDGINVWAVKPSAAKTP